MDEKAFWEQVKKEKGCWQWTGKPNAEGYGRVFIDGRVEYAHRFAFLVLVGDIQPGQKLYNTCQNRRCVNPSHWTTAKSIHNDKSIVKRKNTPKRRYSRRRVKVNDAEVQAIRQIADDTGLTQAAIAARYHISQAQVSRILAGISHG